jgi:hypothetical protein
MFVPALELFAQQPNGGCAADLKADRIEYKCVQKFGNAGTEGRVRISGVVTNIKPCLFKGTAWACLYECYGPKENRVAYQKIPAMHCGQEFAVSYERNWSKNASPVPNYKLVVEVPWPNTPYYPSGNPYHCGGRIDPPKTYDNPANNVLVRSGHHINHLFQPIFKAVLPKRPPHQPVWPGWTNPPRPWKKYRR